MWLNLSTGFIGGGRKNWDGSGGSNGALDYYQETGERYPLVVKLGTITEDIDTADCYSYDKTEDGPVKVPTLAALLQKRGINVAGMQKTVKSTAELEVELNATYAFDAITESGSSLVPVSGPGLQGLQNLGECFIVGIVAFRESEENAIALVGRESLLVSLVIWLECSVGRYCSAIVHLGF